MLVSCLQAGLVRGYSFHNPLFAQTIVVSYKWSDERLYWSTQIEVLRRTAAEADERGDSAAADEARRKLAGIWKSEVRHEERGEALLKQCSGGAATALPPDQGARVAPGVLHLRNTERGWKGGRA